MSLLDVVRDFFKNRPAPNPKKIPRGVGQGRLIDDDVASLPSVVLPPDPDPVTPDPQAPEPREGQGASMHSINAAIVETRTPSAGTFVRPTDAGLPIRFHSKDGRSPEKPRPPRPIATYEPFHHLWDWVEETPEYKKLYALSQRVAPSVRCIICGGDAAGDDYFSLCNAWRVHRKCYDTLHACLSDVQSAEEARKLFESNSQATAGFRLIHTYWWDYPPDWLVRRNAVIEATDGGCSICGKKKNLDVHHECPKSWGGNHALDNLVCLCHEHHQAAHNWDIDSAPGEPAIAPIKIKPRLAETIELLNRAIDAKGQVSFHYVDKSRKHTDRTVSPNGWIQNGRYARCVTAYCHLRREPREFNIRRISNLKPES